MRRTTNVINIAETFAELPQTRWHRAARRNGRGSQASWRRQRAHARREPPNGAGPTSPRRTRPRPAPALHTQGNGRSERYTGELSADDDPLCGERTSRTGEVLERKPLDARRARLAAQPLRRHGASPGYAAGRERDKPARTSNEQAKSGGRSTGSARGFAARHAQETELRVGTSARASSGLDMAFAAGSMEHRPRGREDRGKRGGLDVLFLRIPRAPRGCKQSDRPSS